MLFALKIRGEVDNINMKRKELRYVLIQFATLTALCTVCFYVGYINANASTSSSSANNNIDVASSSSSTSSVVDCTTPTVEVRQSLQQQIDTLVNEGIEKLNKHSSSSSSSYTNTIFPKSTNSYAVGALRVSRDELLDTYDFGVPRKKADNKNTKPEALIIYNTRTSLPSSDATTKNEAMQGSLKGIQSNTGEIAKAPSVSLAMENCDTLNTIFTPITTDNLCHLIIPNFESYHINKYSRMPDFATTRKSKDRIVNHTLPLRHVGRITNPKNGIDEFDLPDLWENRIRKKKGFLLQHFDRLKIFLEEVDRILKELKKLLKERNVVRDNNTVVVLTVNAGQSELFANFICSARSRGLDTSNVLVFPTDEESYQLAQGLGVATYFDKENLGILPSGEAKAYGDPIFASMMYAKVLCVLYVSLLGHDVLFQDVDIVWFKDPLTYFHDQSNVAIQNFDLLFQHDGSAQPRYNPYSANSGFYYVRANKKTSYLFTSLLYHGAVVRKSKSHQQVLVQLLNEHASMFGTKIKVFDKLQTDMFPGGFHYHQDWDTMHKIIEGSSNAYILHMSWTENKVNKLLFFRQMGEWYVNDKCVDKEQRQGLINSATARGQLEGALIDQCCSIEPIFSCHYSDKPSKIPCRDSPKIDPHKGKSFWK